MKRTATRRTEVRDIQRRQLLRERKRGIQQELQSRIQTARADRACQVIDNGEGVDVQEDIAFALIQTQASLIRRIDQALAQIDAGTYGVCIECRGSITANRLRALPFAVRCTTCEDAIERRDEWARRLADKADRFSDVAASQ